MVAVTLVSWGEIGQLILASVLILELQQAAVITDAAVWILCGLDVALLIGVLFYVCPAVASPAAEQPVPEALPGAPRPQGWSIP